MERSTASLSGQQPVIIDPQRFGVSFSIKQCRGFGIDPQECLQWLVHTAGFRRLRLMSYWNEHEPAPGEYDFAALDWQVQTAQRSGCSVSLCVGVRQPRWPENHWPDWAWNLPPSKRSAALLVYIEKVIQRYKHYSCIASYQLENEALLKVFGRRPDIDRLRLQREFKLIKQLDPSRPIIMTTSNSWGIPIRQPIPDIIGFSIYRVMYQHGHYSHTRRLPRQDYLRSTAIRLWHGRPCFIHELQVEPWGSTAIWKMGVAEQNTSMSPQHIHRNIALAKRSGLYPIDLWGGEWWYWRLHHHNDPTIWNTVLQAVTE